MMPAVQGGPGKGIAGGIIRGSNAGFRGEGGDSGSGVSSGGEFGSVMTAALSDASRPAQTSGPTTTQGAEGAGKTAPQAGGNSQAAAGVANGNTKSMVAGSAPLAGANVAPAEGIAHGKYVLETVTQAGSGGQGLPPGEIGPAGPALPAGPSGVTGAAGSAGSAGSTGSTGSTGSAESTGSTGSASASRADATGSAGASAAAAATPGADRVAGETMAAAAQPTVIAKVTDIGQTAGAGALVPLASGKAGDPAQKTDVQMAEGKKADTRKPAAKNQTETSQPVLQAVPAPGMTAGAVTVVAAAAAPVSVPVAAPVAVPMAKAAGSAGDALGRVGSTVVTAGETAAAANVAAMSGAATNGSIAAGPDGFAGGVAGLTAHAGSAMGSGGTASGHGAHSGDGQSGTVQIAAGQSGLGLAVAHPQNAATGAATTGGLAGNGFTATLLQGHPGVVTGAVAAGHSGVQHFSGGAGAANPYARMDEPQRATLVYASPQKMSVAVSDPGLGSFQVRAQSAGAQVAASLATTSAATHAQLSGHLPSLTAFLQDQRVDVTRVTVVQQGLTGGDSGARNFGGQQQRQSRSGSQGPRAQAGRISAVGSGGAVLGAGAELGVSEAGSGAAGSGVGAGVGTGVGTGAGGSSAGRMESVDLHA